MKNDFINNMTHEFKTPISAVSLAAQMLQDESVSKSPEMFQRLSGVITSETKRLRFQVDKVLQMSMFDDKNTAALNMKEIDANELMPCLRGLLDSYIIMSFARLSYALSTFISVAAISPSGSKSRFTRTTDERVE